MRHILDGGIWDLTESREYVQVVQGVVPGIEGSRGKDDWLLIDAGSVIIHVFTEESRAAYDFENIWRSEDGSNVRRVKGKEQSIQTLQNMRI